MYVLLEWQGIDWTHLAGTPKFEPVYNLIQKYIEPKQPPEPGAITAVMMLVRQNTCEFPMPM